MNASASLYALAVQAAEMDGLARAADVPATDLPNDGGFDQKGALAGLARSLATLLRQHTAALDKLAVGIARCVMESQVRMSRRETCAVVER